MLNPAVAASDSASWTAPALSTTTLPRSHALTDLLLAPTGPPVPAADLDRLRLQLTVSLGQRWQEAGACRMTRIRLDRYALRRAGSPARRAPEPFRWSPANARRSLGLLAVRACVAGGQSTPLAGLRAAVAPMVDGGPAGRMRRGGLAGWLSTLDPGALTVVEAEALTWATALLDSLDWPRLTAGAEIGPPDRWWEVPGCRGLALRGRADVRVQLEGPTGTVLFSIGGGAPGPTSRLEVLLPALVESLVAGPAPAPARSVGWWPACGRVVAAEVDTASLAALVDALGALDLRSLSDAA